jgi:hypothetical protein
LPAQLKMIDDITMTKSQSQNGQSRVVLAIASVAVPRIAPFLQLGNAFAQGPVLGLKLIDLHAEFDFPIALSALRLRTRMLSTLHG